MLLDELNSQGGATSTLKTLIIYAHPNPKSFNAAIRQATEAEVKETGGEVRTHDLYATGFNAILKSDDFTELAAGRVPADVQPLQDDIRWAELLVVIFPTWWASVPAILKGYFDRVLSNGFAFQYGPGGAEGLLKGKRAIVFQTTGTPGEVLEPSGMTRAMTACTDMGVLQFCGLEVAAHEYFYGVPYVSDTDREQMLGRVRETIGRVAPVRA